MRIASCLGLLLLASTAASAAPGKGTKASKASTADEDMDVEAEADAKPSKRSKAKAKAKAPTGESDEKSSRKKLDESGDDETEAEDDEKPADSSKRAAAADESEDGDELEVEPMIVRTAPRARAKREFYFRAGVAHVKPRTTSSGMVLEPVGIAKLMPMEPPKGGIVTDDSNVFTAILGFAPATFRGYLAFETLIGIPKSSKLKATGDLATKSLAPNALDLIPTGVPPLGEEIGEASAAPLMVTAVVRTPELGGRVRLYAGAGPSVLLVRSAKVTNKVLTEVATPRIETSPTVGVVAQIGVDVKLYKQLHARLDLKEMWYLPTETRISNIHVRTTIPLLETVEVGSSRSQVQANPIVVQFGIGASF
jgi:outer membrane protein W